MRKRTVRILAVFSAAALTAAACGSDRDKATTTTTAVTTTTAASTTSAATATTTASTTGDTTAESTAPTDTGDTGGTTVDTSAETTAETAGAPTTEAAPDVPMFGDAPWPCSAGDGNNADDGTEVGVTKDAITLATGDDAGYAGSPGLDHEMGDAMKAFVSKCNDLGGINGRKITLNYYDAAVLNVATAMQSACDAKSFFLVGEGWSFDSNQEETRLGCGLPAVPGFAVSAAFSNGKDMYNPLPNPADQYTASAIAEMGKLFPDEVQAVGDLAGNYSATQESRDKLTAAAPAFGWKFVSTNLEYNIAGESDWTPFVKQLTDAGAKAVYWVGTCLPGLQLFTQTAVANGYNPPILTDSNHYAAGCAAANTDGAMDNVYMRLAFVPFEEASVNKATQDYIDLMKEKGGDIALLGAQSASAFLLWATAASACGDTLTRTCVLDNLKNTHDWTGNGLHVAGDPGANTAPTCGMLMRLHGTAYERVAPEKPGTFDCDDSWAAPVVGTPAVLAAKLDANRISQQFATGG